MSVNAGAFRHLVAVEQYDGSQWNPYFEWYCSVQQETGPGDVRTFVLEGRWREEFDLLAGLNNHSEGYRVVWSRTPDQQRLLQITDVVLPIDRGEALRLECEEVAE